MFKSMKFKQPGKPLRGTANVALAFGVIAGLATIANVAAQAIVIWLYDGPYSVPGSVVVGTAAGVPVKYALEKYHIFGFQARSFAHDAKLFITYCFFGVFTTGLFWSVEFAFDRAFASDAMRYLGAVVGLAISYSIRYQLDKRYVFVQ